MTQKPESGQISVQSDTAEIHHTEGLAIHKGHVILTQNDRIITADTLTLKRDTQGSLLEIHAEGSPAHFNVSLNPDEAAWFGSAAHVRYLPQKNELLLEGSALLQREDQMVQGPLIRYDLIHKIASTGDSQNTRTTMILQTK
jgi:lipopolysaccharide transport protein LptA